MHGGAEHEHLRVAFLQREPERGRTAEREEVVGTCAKPEGGKGFRKEGVDSRVKCGQEASREEGAGGGSCGNVAGVLGRSHARGPAGKACHLRLEE